MLCLPRPSSWTSSNTSPTRPRTSQGMRPTSRRAATWEPSCLRKGAAPLWVDLGPSAPIAVLVERWRASHGLGKAPDPKHPDPATELREKVWKPLEAHLGQASVVLISPYGPLTGLPFAALPGKKLGTFLLEERAIATIAVPQLLPDLVAPPAEGQKPPSASLLLVGNIDFGKAEEKLVPAPQPRRYRPSVRCRALWTKWKTSREGFRRCSRVLQSLCNTDATPPRRPSCAGTQTPLPAPGHARLLRRPLDPLGAGLCQPE